MSRNHVRRHRIIHLALLAAAMMVLAVVAGCGASPPSAESFQMAAPAMDSGAVEYSDKEGMAVAESPDAAPVPQTARKVIANAYTELVVDDTQSSVDEITAAVDGLGGYISQTNLYRDSYGGRNLLRGSLTLRVPADQLEPLIAQLEEMALEVRSKNIEREDVTDQYSDIEAQLRNLEATENELRELLAEVRNRPNASSEDILAVHRDLTQIRGEIEQLQGRKNMMDGLIALSTLNVTLIPDEANRPVVEDQWAPGTVIRNATRQLVNTFQFFGSAAIWIIVYLLPMLLLLLLPIVILVLLIRWLVNRSRRGKEKPVEEPTAE